MPLKVELLHKPFLCQQQKSFCLCHFFLTRDRSDSRGQPCDRVEVTVACEQRPGTSFIIKEHSKYTWNTKTCQEKHWDWLQWSVLTVAFMKAWESSILKNGLGSLPQAHCWEALYCPAQPFSKLLWGYMPKPGFQLSCRMVEHSYVHQFWFAKFSLNSVWGCDTLSAGRRNKTNLEFPKDWLTFQRVWPQPSTNQ